MAIQAEQMENIVKEIVRVFHDKYYPDPENKLTPPEMEEAYRYSVDQVTFILNSFMEQFNKLAEAVKNGNE